MNVNEYEKQFDEILDGKNTAYPYDNEEYINYVKLNKARMKRWSKVGKIAPDLAETLSKIQDTQNWILITEPWCGDAAHSHEFIKKLAELNPKISLTVRNRDTPDSEIDQYLTNGGKSIPKLIVRDVNGEDLFDWGPRPKTAQELYMSQRADTSLSDEDKKRALQSWYNKDKGTTIQQELNVLLKELDFGHFGN